MTKVEVATYSRHSSKKQDEKSCEDQEAMLAELSKKKVGVTPHRQFRDEAKSGTTTTGRVGLEKLLAWAQQPAAVGAERVLFVEALDRLGRSIYDSFDIVRRLHRDGGVRIVTADGRDSNDPGFKSMLLADSFVADVFIDTLRAKTKRGMEGHTRRGFAVTRPEFGYRHIKVVNDEGDENARKVKDEVEAPLVSRIFAVYAEGGVSAWALATTLNGEGHLRRGKPWHRAQIAAILRHRAYLGEVRYCGTVLRQDEDLRLVSGEVFACVQARMDEYKRRVATVPRQPNGNLVRGGTLTAKHLLTGTIRCARCGAAIAIAPGYTNRAAFYYGCPHHMRRRSACDNAIHVNGPMLERAVIDALLDVIIDQKAVDFVTAEVQRKLSAGVHGAVAVLRNLRRQQQTVERSIAGVVAEIERRVSTGRPASDALNDRLDVLEKEKRRLAEQVAAQPDPERATVTVLRSAVESYLGRAGELLRGNPEQARNAIEQLIIDGKLERVGWGKARVTFRVAPLGVLADFLVVGRKGTVLDDEAQHPAVGAGRRTDLAQGDVERRTVRGGRGGGGRRGLGEFLPAAEQQLAQARSRARLVARRRGRVIARRTARGKQLGKTVFVPSGRDLLPPGAGWGRRRVRRRRRVRVERSAVGHGVRKSRFRPDLLRGGRGIA
jgi:DNA invertase Pin-like site-specific DNA recombinase